MPQGRHKPLPKQPDDRHTRQQTAETSKKTKSSTHATSTAENPVIIAVMGATGTGKTTFINLASGSNFRVGQGLESCTDTINVAQPFELDGRPVVIIDTPGFDDTTKSDADMLHTIAFFLASMYECREKLAGIIYIHRISDFRMGGISTRNFKMFRQLCGDSASKNVVIVTNMWGEVSKEIGEARETELANNDKFFKPVLDKGGRILRHDNSAESVKKILQVVIKNSPLPLQIQREIVDEKKNISQTAAGAELNRELLLQQEQHEEEMKQLQEEMKTASQSKDEEAKQELEEASKQLQRNMDKVQADTQKLASEHYEEKERMQRRLQQLSELYNRAEADSKALQQTGEPLEAESGGIVRQIYNLVIRIKSYLEKRV